MSKINKANKWKERGIKKSKRPHSGHQMLRGTPDGTIKGHWYESAQMSFKLLFISGWYKSWQLSKCQAEFANNIEC